jgi:L-glyceraldehyde 3-phosphate reductase
LDQAKENGVGFIAFSPLAQGLLTGRYLDGIPADSRMAKEKFLKSSALTPAMHAALMKLNGIAAQRGQTLAEMALAWCLKDDRVTSVIIGASRVAQIEDDFQALKNTAFSAEELAAIDEAVRGL